MKKGKLLFIFCLIVQQITWAQEKGASYKPPRLTVVVVIDQFANHELQKFYSFFNGGIKYLYDKGVRYTNAFYPHGMPETGVGHTALGTGTLPQDHGIIGNLWNDEQGNVIFCDDDNAPNALVFSSTGVYDYGKSAKNIMVDTLSDQLMMNITPLLATNSIALSIKSRAAIGMAGRKGKAIWFDADSGNFTSSKAYFEQLPAWVTSFNDDSKTSEITTFTWQSLYPENNAAYNFALSRDYQFTAPKKTMVNVATPIDKKQKAAFDLFSKTPLANQLLLNLTERCIDEHLAHTDRLVIWVSLSSLDLVGHIYGPYSLELIDMLYQVDQQLQKFIDHISTKVAPEDTLFALTADHGVFPILELIKQQGFDLAQRTDVIKLMQQFNDCFAQTEHPLVAECNNIIKEKYGIEKIIINFKMPQFYLDIKQLKKLDFNVQDEIINELKKLLRKQASIREVWTFDELITLPFPFNDVRNYLKSQLYSGRSGQLICLVHPYNYLDDYKSGTAHGTPYDYDTHVPLMMYQKGILENKTITQTVYMQQLPVTLAALLNTPRPSASTFDLLPGLDPNLFLIPQLSLTTTGTQKNEL
ncbi:MAG: alkaline phosphatase family protein [Candidatus Babeliaceae bacterium]